MKTNVNNTTPVRKACQIAAVISVLAVTLFIETGFTQDSALTDSEIRKALIDQSIRAYSGNCPCPYNSASNGSRCGKRSAWSRAGGQAPYCYDSDISDDDVEKYRLRMKNMNDPQS